MPLGIITNPPFLKVAATWGNVSERKQIEPLSCFFISGRFYAFKGEIISERAHFCAAAFSRYFFFKKTLSLEQSSYKR
jgi:hypothetical protein